MNYDVIFRSCESGCKTRVYGVCADSFEEAEKEAAVIAAENESYYESWYEVVEARQKTQSPRKGGCFCFTAI